MIEVPTSTQAITIDWLTRTLKEAGHLRGSITELKLETIGEGVGLMGELARCHLAYDGPESLPATIIAKCAAQNENIEVAKVLDFYNREVNFYNHIGQDCPMRVPQSFYGAVNQTTYDCVVLMEDLGSASSRDQLVGASTEEVYSAIREIAKLHAGWWGKADLSPWMYDMMSVDESLRMQALIYQPAVESAIEKFDYLLDATTKAVLRKVGENFPEFWAKNLSPVETFLHGDYRQDNMLYPAGESEAIVMDWQISGRGQPVFDIAYFMCQSVPSEIRADIERDLLSFYSAQLAELGVDYPSDQCFEDYRRLVLGCLIYPVTVCGTLDLSNERGKALGESMMKRNLTAIEDLGAAALIVDL